MSNTFKKYLLKQVKASSCKELETIQSLWSGYGRISRYELEGSELKTVVVKYISLDQNGEHPRGWNTNLSHQRKVHSYEVETRWYHDYSHRCDNHCRIPAFLGSYNEGQRQWIILEDLDHHFPLRKEELAFKEVEVCIRWLANFHIRFLGVKAVGLWETGSYWHLATRPDELEQMKDLELRSKAALIDAKLNQAKFMTLIHGDAKLANFCFSEDGREVAAVDFQYVGEGSGVKDLAYFLGSCLSGEDQELYEEHFLQVYFEECKKAAERYASKADMAAFEKEGRELYPYAIADFTRFLLGWMPGHWKINAYSMKVTRKIVQTF